MGALRIENVEGPPNSPDADFFQDVDCLLLFISLNTDASPTENVLPALKKNITSYYQLFTSRSSNKLSLIKVVGCIDLSTETHSIPEKTKVEEMLLQLEQNWDQKIIYHELPITRMGKILFQKTEIEKSQLNDLFNEVKTGLLGGIDVIQSPLSAFKVIILGAWQIGENLLFQYLGNGSADQFLSYRVALGGSISVFEKSYEM